MAKKPKPAPAFAPRSKKEKLATMSLINHLLELRRRLFWCFIVLLIAFVGCYYFAKDIYGFLAEPLFAVWQTKSDTINRQMLATSLTEIFFTNIRLAFYTALIIAMPFLLIQFWLFIAPGLYRNEKKSFTFFFIATPVFFTLGAGFVYYLVIPLAWQFFLGFEQFSTLPDGNLMVEIQPKVSDYLTLILQLILAFGFSFETPVLLILLMQLGVIDRAWLIKKRRYAIVIAFVIAAILTPPDPLSQLSLAIPLIFLYEFSIITSFFMGKNISKQPK
ncbi:MAG: twin-arginine translocase subunit TatC [Alphaproteobacteria bacterium]